MPAYSFGEDAQRFLVSLLVAAFAMNWIWEMSQMYLYRDMSEMNFSKAMIYCTLATFVDSVLTVGAYSLGRCFSREVLYVFMALFGATCAMAIEFAALSLGIWSYETSMPSVPFLNIGILPLIQLSVLMPLALAIAVYWTKRKS